MAKSILTSLKTYAIVSVLIGSEPRDEGEREMALGHNQALELLKQGKVMIFHHGIGHIQSRVTIDGVVVRDDAYKALKERCLKSRDDRDYVYRLSEGGDK